MTTTEVATLVDSNVLLDVIREDPVWSSWSAQSLARVADEGPLVINSIIYAEVSTTYATIEEMDAVLAAAALVRSEVPWPAAFLAGRCHVEYRRRGGARARTLPDSSSEPMLRCWGCGCSPETPPDTGRTSPASTSSLRTAVARLG